MSRLDQLISQYCPAGVPMVRLGEVADILYGCPFDAALFTDDSRFIPIIRIRDIVPGVPSTYYQGEYDGKYIIHKGDILVGMDGNFNLAKWNSIDGVLCQRSCKIEANRNGKVLNNFLFHYLGPVFKKIEDNTAGGSVKHLSAKAINEITIPLPPLPVQEEIVRILDAMSDLVTNLDAEISARQKQYEHAREKLLTFGEEVEKKTLGEVGIFYGGLSGKSKEDFENGTARYISYKNVFLNAAADLGASDFVCVLPNEHQNAVEYGDILFTGSSETPDECGFSSVINKHPKESIYLNSFCFGLRLNNCSLLYPDFSKHLFRSSNIRMKIGKTANGVTRYNVSKKLFANISIPLPSLSVQQSIVERLDKMESLIQNLQAERDLRQKQYEYYREKLLTFE